MTGYAENGYPCTEDQTSLIKRKEDKQMSKFAKVSHSRGIRHELYSYKSSDMTESEIDMLDRLEDILPHGSGINGDWNFDILKNGNIQCHNTYDAMDEWGGYCHYYDFTVTVKPNGDKFDFIRFSFRGNRERSCCGFGLADYIAETCSYALE